MHVIVLEEDDLTQELRTLADLVYLLDQTLSGTISRMRFTGVEELYGVVRIVHNLGKTLQVSEQQVSTLVGGKTATEADEQCIGVDLVHQRHHARGVTLVLEPALAELLADVLHQLCLQGHAGSPHFLVAHIIDSLPD